MDGTDEWGMRSVRTTGRERDGRGKLKDVFFSSAGTDAVVALALLSLDVLSLCLPGVMRRGSESEAIEERTFHVLHPAVAPAARMVFGMGRGVVALWVTAVDDLVLEELRVLAV